MIANLVFPAFNIFNAMLRTCNIVSIITSNTFKTGKERFIFV